MPHQTSETIYDRADSNEQQREDIFTYAAYRRELSGWAQEWVEHARAELASHVHSKRSSKAVRIFTRRAASIVDI
jgi:hypothetical protein